MSAKSGSIALLVVVALVASCGTDPEADRETDGVPVAFYSSPGGQSVEVAHPSEDALALVDWAFLRIQTAGLPEPTVNQINFAPSMPGCQDATGWAVSGGDKAEIVVCLTTDRICRHLDGVRSFTLAGKLCVLHELSHLWLAQYVSQVMRAEFMALTGAEEWRDPDLPRDERGIEQAADTIAWGLLGGTIEILGRPLPPCEQLHDGFAILTNTAPMTDC